LVTICGCPIGDLIGSPKPAVQLLTADLITLSVEHRFESGSLFRVWLPTRRALAQFVSACQSANRTLLRKQMSNSLKASSHSPQVAANILRERRPISFTQGVEELGQLLRNSGEFPLAGELESALVRTERVFNREVISNVGAAH
jgi:hypothetical protein